MEKKKRRRPASAVPAGGGPGGRNETDRRLSRLVTPFLTTKSGSRMPNWIALTRLTGADEYGKRSIVAMMGKKEVRLLPSTLLWWCFFSSALCCPALAMSRDKRSHAPRACAGHALPLREMDRHAAHTGRQRDALFSFFSSSFALRFPPLRRWGAEVNRVRH